MISPVSCHKDQSIFSQIINLCTKEPVNRSDIVVEPLLSPDDYLDYTYCLSYSRYSEQYFFSSFLVL